jgi:hypothetical protein
MEPEFTDSQRERLIEAYENVMTYLLTIHNFCNEDGSYTERLHHLRNSMNYIHRGVFNGEIDLDQYVSAVEYIIHSPGNIIDMLKSAESDTDDE